MTTGPGKGGKRMLGTGEINTTMVTWQGRTQSVKEWSIEMRFSVQALMGRVQMMQRGAPGYTIDRVMDPTPMQRGWKHGGLKSMLREPLSPELVRDADDPFERDATAQEIVSSFSDGLTLDAIGQLYGMSRERVRQIENSAMRKVRGAPGGNVIVELLRARDAERRVNTNTFEQEETLYSKEDSLAKRKASRAGRQRSTRRLNVQEP